MQLGRRLGGETIYDCSACEQNPGLKQQLGHDGPPEGFWRENLITDQPLARCPLRDLLEVQRTEPARWAEFTRHADVYYPAYLDGHLLKGGGMSSQPARYLAYMLALRDAGARIEQKHLALTEKEPTR